jgi:hypothetical protein
LPSCVGVVVDHLVEGEEVVRDRMLVSYGNRLAAVRVRLSMATASVSAMSAASACRCLSNDWMPSQTRNPGSQHNRGHVDQERATAHRIGQSSTSDPAEMSPIAKKIEISSALTRNIGGSNAAPQ